MSPQTSADEPILRALLDVVQSLRGLAARTKSICELGAHSGRPMDPLVQRSRQMLAALESATDIMSMFDDDHGGLKIEREAMPGGHEKVIVRCVSNVLESDRAFEANEALDIEKDRVDFRGLSWSIGIPELLSFLESINKTGTVCVTTFDETFTIVINNGQVVHASSSASPAGLRLGDILVSQGATTYRALQDFISEHLVTGACMGAAVVAKGLVSREQLATALEAQVQFLFHRLFNATDATYTFYDGRRSSNEHQVRMNLTRLLLESSVEADGRKSA
ncbi:MAG: hypothetical protein ACI87A_003367 [Planctomycetota bacterium]|jgi:hypothetical protein